jgi:hypothetical protein
LTIYITPQDELHVEYQGIALNCPHCLTLTHVTAVAVPKFEDLSRRKPKHIGIVFRCDACAEPVFLKFIAKAYTSLRIELAANYIEIERARENFPLTYLPEESEGLFKEALVCFAAGCFNAFGAMSRRTAQSLLFGSDNDPWPHQPDLNAERAGILLEVMRDLLYQTFVRKARLMQAMTFRRYVAPNQAETG